MESVKEFIALCFESLEVAEQTALKHPALLHARTGLGETPLHYLAVENQIDAVAVLVRMGAQVDTVNDVGTTPLSDAASLGYEEMVERLLKLGASLDLAGQSAPTLNAAVRSGSVAVVKLILSAGANPSGLDSFGKTALHIAAESDGTHEIVELLLAAGADPMLRYLNKTPLDVAIANSSQRCVDTLSAVQLGAPPSGPSLNIASHS